MTVRWLTAFLDFPAADFDAGVEFWRTVTGSTLSPLRGTRHEFATLIPPDGDAYLRVQRVASGPGGTHLDLHVDDIGAFASRAVALGAEEVAREDGELVVLTSPGGFVFCVVGQPESSRPWPEEGIPDQVCLDISPSRFDSESAFWADLAGWELLHGSHPEFASLRRLPTMPLRILLQRLDDERDGPVTAHLDLAAGEKVDEVLATHRRLGAEPVRRTAGWVTMRDPVGREYCITRRDPKAGHLPG